MEKILNWSSLQLSGLVVISGGCASDFATLKSSDVSNQVSGTRGRLASGEDTDVSLSPKRHLRQLEMKPVLKCSKFTEEEPFRNEGTKKHGKIVVLLGNPCIVADTLCKQS